jgi:hypothetical protein
MSTLSIAKSRNLESVTPKKGSAKSNATARRKVPSTAATPKKPLRSVESKAERVAATKTGCILRIRRYANLPAGTTRNWSSHWRLYAVLYGGARI